ncbi:RIB43A-like with coiled-coils protein 2 [Pseudochaenichthys georgianus]|uniref:RIB43A-like with coiled-coils protein 2 n=1 Tax=Pseudochaenichthys georgianus TaxID=52239 RepID=UPI00146E9543|nr:RIB43A-like with coiled-coils protein 2 [Pseudochaenichthys georgianus]
MFNFDLPSDRVARTSLQRQRNDETERRERVFNDKIRMLWVDKEALDSQLKEKCKQEEAAKLEQQARDAEMLHNSKVACLLHSREVKEKRAMEKAVVDYRHQYQQPQCQSDYDLSDPHRCGNTDPGDAQMMLPGLLGEDPHSESRGRRQREQLREWLLQQQGEQAAERQQQTLEEQRYDLSRTYMEKKALQLEGIEMERRKAETVATKEFNLAMIEEKRRQDGEHHVSGDVAGATMNTLQEQLTGVALQRPLVPDLCPSSHRRALPESLQQIIQFQKYQIEEKKRVELEKKRDEEQHAHMRMDSARTALLLERQQARLDRQERQHVDRANVLMAQTHKQQKPDIERGSIDDSFFSKFNTCSR